MSRRAFAAYLNGFGVTLPVGWYLGYTWGETAVYGVAILSLTFLFLSYALEKTGDE
jgi:hypothetical protein